MDKLISLPAKSLPTIVGFTVMVLLVLVVAQKTGITAKLGITTT